MNKLAFAILATAMAGAAALAPARAQSIALDCSGSNLCVADVSGITYDTLSWSFDKRSTDALFPRNCTNRLTCSFYCPRRAGLITATVYASLNQQVVASATSQALCTAEPL
ncbi:hypothetical protein [Vulcaniibacterium tengchongense]|uniref:Secreted protein n=1 Tax=Vulcaniibacterium tengchongense TaxID=1273429 RepID=A0A3N4VRS2_9GAMM|nr:hypothetical protein [Vulcaniibacterium tengchongense]RPE75744.1 hypothetical protein EDC50_2638 [Vulcaniibacterium tengchongense]